MSGSTSATGTKSAVILVVDVDPTTLASVQRLLSDEFEVLSAQSSQEARAVLETSSVNLVLTAFGLPGETGVDFARWLHATGHECPVLLTTANLEHEQVQRALAMGWVKGIIDKPWGVVLLKEEVARHVGRYLAGRGRR